ncbi:hypothetical protein BC938DRAFT_482062 [Jimgerdemannia flammicorona]|uniref:Tyrosyl-DNA phosphodiesterase I n=1 Tax=Jimgerdemannia flammicorona TaxID=994334 RepID=A0A433QWJ6_9FUNG|nr:hypothetical protein BC938DRAFT_482062 [Jimgerdemannia flammicorona]
MVQLNYHVDLDWLMSKLPPEKANSLPTTVVHGWRQDEAHIIKEQVKAFQNVKLVFPSLPIQYGTHHTKAMLLFYNDDTMRVVIHTANLVSSDWRNKTQAVYTSPVLHKKRSPQLSSSPAEMSMFEKDLTDYFKAYGHQLSRFCELFKDYDFSECKAIIVASVPGYHTGVNKKKWGHLRLRSVLEQHVVIPDECRDRSTVVCQFSSIGSLTTSDTWFREVFGASLSSAKNRRQCRDPTLKMVFPTVEDVKDSLEGWNSGGSIPFDHNNYMKQKAWMRNYLCKWRGIRSGRHRAAPHIKTYARFTVNSAINNADSEGSSVEIVDGSESDAILAWFLVTSSNLSKAAWGDLQKKGEQLMVRSYELGVLIWPEMFKTPEGENAYMLNATKTNLRPIPPSALVPQISPPLSSVTNVVPVRLPYDLPLTSYDFDAGDECWTWNVPRSEPDWLGNFWSGS